VRAGLSGHAFLRVASSALALTGIACTHVYVQPVRPGTEQIEDVCIERNPKVLVSDFLTVVEEGFRRHGIETRIVSEASDACDYTLTYTALRSWDFVPYLNYAELRLQRGETTIGTATYSHAGGFGFNKWRGTRAKIAPVIDELLEDLPARP
jgi:hypothetical protein